MSNSDSMDSRIRLLKVYFELRNTSINNPKTVNQIIDSLVAQGYPKPSKETIRQDMAAIRALGISIVQCDNNQDGSYWEGYDEETLLNLDDWEIKIMLDSIYNAKFITPENVDRIQRTIFNQLNQKRRTKFKNLIQINGDVKNGDENSGEYLRKILDAMNTEKQVEFNLIYLDDTLTEQLKLDDNGKAHVYRLNVYAINYSNNNYYIYGCHYSNRNKKLYDLKEYRLDRIRNLTISSERRIPKEECESMQPDPVGFIKKQIESSVMNYPGENIHVVIEYESNDTNNNLLYDLIGNKKPVLKKADNGKNTASFTICDSITAVNWFAQYADRFTVINPESFRNKIIERLDLLSNAYKV